MSVIVPAKNEGHRIAATLRALERQSLPPHEVIVVDGHSEDDTVRVAQSHGAVVLQEEFGTRAGANEVGLRAARGDLIAFTDADCEPRPDWLSKLVASFDGDAVGVGGRIENDGDSYWQRAIDVALDTVVGSANSVQGRPFGEARFVTSISGCNSMYRKADLLRVGGFRTDLVTTEDTELNHRLLRLGKLLYVPGAVVRHRHQRGLRDFGRRMVQYGHGRGQSLLVGPPLWLSLAAPAVLLVSWLFPLFGILAGMAYASVLLASSVGPAVRHRRVGFLLALPIVFIVEHAAYILGFWKGLFSARVPPRKRAEPRGEVR